jgi:hypothetical protein
MLGWFCWKFKQGKLSSGPRSLLPSLHAGTVFPGLFELDCRVHSDHPVEVDCLEFRDCILKSSFSPRQLTNNQIQQVNKKHQLNSETGSELHPLRFNHWSSGILTVKFYSIFKFLFSFLFRLMYNKILSNRHSIQHHTHLLF